jgi:2-desacetyl-2-hydroxyethyl bacteriochlorophyllide A dehydrogenase
MKTKQIVFTKAYTAELLEIECPAPKRGEVTVRLEYSAISAGTEKANFTGQRNTISMKDDDEPTFPRTVGYSAAGTITALGEGVSDLAIGDKVIVYGGKHQKIITIARGRVMKIPDRVTTREACMAYISIFPLAAIRKTRLEIGESALVMGLGILGVFAVQELRAAGAYPIIAADPIESRRKLALALGADYAFDPTEEGFADRVKAVSGGGVRVCIEVTGLGIGLIQALDCMKELGRIALLGCTRSSKFEIDYYGKVHGRGISLIGAHTIARPRSESSAGLWTDKDDLRTVLGLLAGGRLDFRGVIGEICSPADAQEVYTRLVNDKNVPVGVLFDWSKI